jgi:hypothetical protein
MTERDDFIRREAAKLLQPGEEVLNTAYVVKQPGLVVQILLVGGLLLFLLTKAYYAVATTKRIILIRTKQGFLKPAMVNTGVEEIDLSQVAEARTSGIANNRSITFVRRDGKKDTIRIAPWSKLVTGQKEFLEQVPARINQKATA